MDVLKNAKLTDRQVSCLTGKALGKNNGQIALDVGVGESTVAKELYTIYRILGVKNAPAAVALGMAEGWLKLPAPA
jgi:DNA-binding NarL/FixJ family response regulator